MIHVLFVIYPLTSYSNFYNTKGRQQLLNNLKKKGNQLTNRREKGLDFLFTYNIYILKRHHKQQKITCQVIFTQVRIFTIFPLTFPDELTKSQKRRQQYRLLSKFNPQGTHITYHPRPRRDRFQPFMAADKGIRFIDIDIICIYTYGWISCLYKQICGLHSYVSKILCKIESQSDERII